MVGELVRKYSHKSMFDTQYYIDEVLPLNLLADVTCTLGATSYVVMLLPLVNS